MSRLVRRAIALLCLSACALAFGGAPAFAQAGTSEPVGADAPVTDAQRAAAEKAADQNRSALQTLTDLLAAKREAEIEVEALRLQLEQAPDETSKKDIQEQRTAAQAKLKDIEARVTGLTTGVTSEEFENTGKAVFNLQAELENLAKPFVAMLRSATENARQIENLRAEIAASSNRVSVAERALERLAGLRAANATANADVESDVARVLSGEQETWEERLTDARTARDTALQQLRARLDAREASDGGVGTYVAEFLRTRGYNLFLGVTVFVAVFLGLRLIGRIAGAIQVRRGIPRNFASRLASIVFQALTLVTALFAMLVVFNGLTDWLLLGLTVVVVLALAWVGLKMIPQIVEQTTLLLNLGAVQEGERVMIGGVPWRVERLDYYTDLVNPALEGGHFTVPVRELSGHHSRPSAVDEVWFPTLKGDWLQLSDGRVCQVAIQTPELVQLVELGGARLTYTTSDFIAQVARNLSHGFRAEIEVGIDYQHQSIATRELPRALEDYVRNGLVRLIGANALNSVAVELKQAGASSIDYEVEADVKGAFADKYEDIEREMARLAVEACNINGWALALPQMVLHRSAHPSTPPVQSAGPLAQQASHTHHLNGKTSPDPLIDRIAPGPGPKISDRIRSIP
jgi:hypothetical protein